ncbi:hypothetical protein BJ508DRAFT_329079 [Ascobolus immersus RN42]|uniref:Uncharacterized protein n=1 Tax=Ascobolus immersus RN42 TaxID=1160509 RepID=A0A3N4I303_ASCIM|nr:hypothetical protein BJ508DRAFT_329079 [Ascobolus immersus RN42]
MSFNNRYSSQQFYQDGSPLLQQHSPQLQQQQFSQQGAHGSWELPQLSVVASSPTTTGRPRRQSVSSLDYPLSSNASSVPSMSNPFENISPEPSFISTSAGTQIVSTSQAGFFQSLQLEDGMRSTSPIIPVSDSAMKLVNQFLDFMLYSFLSRAKTTSLRGLRPAVTEVLRVRLATEAIAGADHELESYLGGDLDAESEAVEAGEWDLYGSWKRSRLRCMVFSSLGDVEDREDDDYPIYDPQEGGYVTPIAYSVVSPAVAVWLTSILEFVGEQALLVAGHAAVSRFSNMRTSALASGDAEAIAKSQQQTISVADLDVEKIALNSGLGRLWRQWKKKGRTSGSISLSHRESQSIIGRLELSPTTSTASNGVRRVASAEQVKSNEQAQQSTTTPAGPTERLSLQIPTDAGRVVAQQDQAQELSAGGSDLDSLRPTPLTATTDKSIISPLSPIIETSVRGEGSVACVEEIVRSHEELTEEMENIANGKTRPKSVVLLCTYSPSERRLRAHSLPPQPKSTFSESAEHDMVAEEVNTGVLTDGNKVEAYAKTEQASVGGVLPVPVVITEEHVEATHVQAKGTGTTSNLSETDLDQDSAAQKRMRHSIYGFKDLSSANKHLQQPDSGPDDYESEYDGGDEDDKRSTMDGDVTSESLGDSSYLGGRKALSPSRASSTTVAVPPLHGDEFDSSLASEHRIQQVRHHLDADYPSDGSSAIGVARTTDNFVPLHTPALDSKFNKEFSVNRESTQAASYQAFRRSTNPNDSSPRTSCHLNSEEFYQANTNGQLLNIPSLKVKSDAADAPDVRGRTKQDTNVDPSRLSPQMIRTEAALPSIHERDETGSVTSFDDTHSEVEEDDVEEEPEIVVATKVFVRNNSRESSVSRGSASREPSREIQRSGSTSTASLISITNIRKGSVGSVSSPIGDGTNKALRAIELANAAAPSPTTSIHSRQTVSSGKSSMDSRNYPLPPPPINSHVSSLPQTPFANSPMDRGTPTSAVSYKSAWGPPPPVPGTPERGPERGRRSSSFSKQRPFTAGSTHKAVKTFMTWQSDGKRSSEDARSSHSSGERNAELAKMDEKERSFEELIQSGGTIHCTITPDPIRNVEATEFNYGRPRTGISNSTDAPRPSTVKSMTSISTKSSFGRIPASAAREARVTDNSTQSLALFLASTGPPDSYPAPGTSSSRGTTAVSTNYDKRSLRLKTSASARAPLSTSYSSMSGSTAVTNNSFYSQRPKLIAKEPTGTSTAESTSALADFFRSTEPPLEHGDVIQRRISKSVAPFRNTMDSTQMDVSPGAYSQNSDSTTLNSAIQNDSYQSSFASQTALINSSHRGAQDFDMGPKRTQRRVRDPYAIDDDDEDEMDEQTLDDLDLVIPPVPSKHRGRAESISEAVKHNQSPRSHIITPPPRTSTSESHEERTIQKKSSSMSLMGRLARTTSRKNSISSVSEMVPPVPAMNPKFNQNHTPLAIRNPNTLNSPAPSASPASSISEAPPRTSLPPHLIPPQKQRNFAKPMGGARDARANYRTDTESLADFLKNTPPPPSTISRMPDPPEVKESGFSKFSKGLGWRKKARNEVY